MCIRDRIAGVRPDVVFNALHGSPGEDGTVQGMLDLMQIPYTHSGIATSVIAIDKELTKLLLVPHGIRMPEGRIVESAAVHDADPLPRPYVLKPVNEGSSVGVAIVTQGGNYGCLLYTSRWRAFDPAAAVHGRGTGQADAETGARTRISHQRGAAHVAVRTAQCRERSRRSARRARCRAGADLRDIACCRAERGGCARVKGVNTEIGIIHFIGIGGIGMSGIAEVCLLYTSRCV